jgi:hypothetical protein
VRLLSLVYEEDDEGNAQLLLSLLRTDIGAGLPPRPPMTAPQMRRRSSAASLDGDCPGSDEREDSPGLDAGDDDDGLASMEMDGAVGPVTAKLGAFSMPLGVAA